MSGDDSVLLTYGKRSNSNVFKMAKAKTALILVMIIFSCGLIFSITDAYPTQETETLEEGTKLGNNSRLVITHVVKTIEFEVGVVDDDGIVDENSTDPNASEFYETDIQMLNVDLLREVVNQATSEENSEGTMEPKQPQSGNEEKTEEQPEQVQNITQVQLTPSNG